MPNNYVRQSDRGDERGRNVSGGEAVRLLAKAVVLRAVKDAAGQCGDVLTHASTTQARARLKDRTVRDARDWLANPERGASPRNDYKRWIGLEPEAMAALFAGGDFGKLEAAMAEYVKGASPEKAAEHKRERDRRWAAQRPRDKVNAYARSVRAKETPEQREARLSKLRVKAKQRVDTFRQQMVRAVGGPEAYAARQRGLLRAGRRPKSQEQAFAASGIVALESAATPAPLASSRQ